MNSKFTTLHSKPFSQQREKGMKKFSLLSRSFWIYIYVKACVWEKAIIISISLSLYYNPIYYVRQVKHFAAAKLDKYLWGMWWWAKLYLYPVIKLRWNEGTSFYLPTHNSTMKIQFSTVFQLNFHKQIIFSPLSSFSLKWIHKHRMMDWNVAEQ